MSGDIGATADPSDPGARLLVRIGDFIEPLTRFDRSNLSMMESRHEAVDVLVRQVFRTRFETRRSEGNGPLPAGVREVADASALARESEAQLAAARIALPQRLSTWAETHGEDPRARPPVETCFASPEPMGYSAPCAPCSATGRITCSRCNGARELTCETCGGRGAADCATCGKSGDVTCQRCRGAGTIVKQKHAHVRDETAGRTRLEYVQDIQPCPACNRAGKVKCPNCTGRGELTCKACDGRKALACPQCNGQGSKRCETCGGEGSRHHTTSLSCSLDETLEVSPRAAESDVAAALKSNGGVDYILQLAASHRATTEAGRDTLTRDTMAAVPVTSVMIAVGDKRAMIRAFGERQLVLDYRNIAGLMMSDDLAELEAALQTTKLVPPKVNEALFPALATVLASEANVAIAKTYPRRSATETERDHRGAIAADYVRRAGAATRKGLGRAYWASLARGPAAALALPLLLAPLDLVVRGSGVGWRLAVLLTVIAVTFGGAAAGHWWVMRRLQRKLAPSGVPRIGPIGDAMGLSAVWLVGAGAIAAMLSLLIAGLTSWVFPAG